MPTFYEGGAIEEVSQTLSKNEYTQAFYIGQSVISPMHTKWVKTGICLSMAILIISLIPLYKSYFITVWIPFCALAVAVLLAFYFFFIQPKDIKKWAAQIYCTSAFLSIPQKIEIYRDSVIIKNEYEEILEYWTDFAKCVETNSFFVLTGGRERDLLIITKNGMNATQIERISKHFSNEFALRYMKKKR
jgi:hypothetical protein